MLVSDVRSDKIRKNAIDRFSVSPLVPGGGGDSRGKVIVGSECWSESQTLKYTIFGESDTPKIYQPVLRFLDNFAICGSMCSIIIMRLV